MTTVSLPLQGALPLFADLPADHKAVRRPAAPSCVARRRGSYLPLS